MTGLSTITRHGAVLSAVLCGGLLSVQACGLVEADGGAPASGASSGGGVAAGGSSGSGGDACAGLDAPACTENPGCAAYSAHLVVDDCYEGAGQHLGCYPSSSGCDDVIVVARDEAGQAWQFLDGCIPPTFEPDYESAHDQCHDEGMGGAGGASLDDDPTCTCSVK